MSDRKKLVSSLLTQAKAHAANHGEMIRRRGLNAGNASESELNDKVREEWHAFEDVIGRLAELAEG